MPPKQEGRLVADQRQREQEGKSWKSASTLERQRKRARDRAQGAEKGAAKGAALGPGKGKAKDKSQPKGKGSKVPEKGKDKSQPKGKGAKGLDKGKQGPGGKAGKAEAGPAGQPPPPPPSPRQRGGVDIGAQNYPAPKKAGPRQPPVPPSPKRAGTCPSEPSPADSVKTDPEAEEASPPGLRKEQASGHKDVPISGRGQSYQDAPRFSEPALRADTGAPPRANKGPNKMVPSPSPDSSDKEMESKTASPTNSPERLRGEAASGHRTITLENTLAREAEPAEMAVERATTPEGLPPRHADDGAAVSKGSAPPNRGGAPGAMEVDEPTSPARVVALSFQGSSDSEDTKSSSSSPTQGADGEGPVLRLREAVHEPPRGRSPQVVVRRYQGARNQGARNRSGRSQEFHRPPK